MRRAFKDPAFEKEYKKLTGDDPTPLTPEANERRCGIFRENRRLSRCSRS